MSVGGWHLLETVVHALVVLCMLNEAPHSQLMTTEQGKRSRGPSWHPAAKSAQATQNNSDALVPLLPGGLLKPEANPR